MTKVISLRLPGPKLADLDRRAAASGLDRSKYLLRLVNADLDSPQPEGPRRLASAHLLGKFRSQGSSNAKIRAALKKRNEKDR